MRFCTCTLNFSQGSVMIILTVSVPTSTSPQNKRDIKQNLNQMCGCRNPESTLSFNIEGTTYVASVLFHDQIDEIGMSH